MKLTDATNYMAEVSSNLEAIDNLIKDLNSLNNIKDQIRVRFEKDDVAVEYYTNSKTFNVSFEKEIIVSALSDQRKTLYTELIKTQDTISKLLEEK
ncbi:hypothetical protein HIU56_12200 [Enterococcus faecium]|uniref:hypothetical protein n=1 Tax=Enterococcus faecium TaxID=1352 RepID=UPI001C48356A|nr:hypothetical protein [Enterococcus faecium]